MAELNIGGNYLAGLSGGLQAGQAIRGIQDQNMLREIGPQLAAGDANALAQYAQIDPMGAMQLERQRAADARSEQQFNQTTELNAARLEQIRAQTAQQAAAEAENLTEAQRAEELAAAKRTLTAMSVAYKQGPEAFEEWTRQNAQDIMESGFGPRDITYDNFLPLAAGLTGFVEAFESANTIMPDEPDPEYRYEDGQYWDSNNPAAGAQPIPDFQKKNDGLSITLPDGTSVTQGVPLGQNPALSGTPRDPSKLASSLAADDAAYLSAERDRARAAEDLEGLATRLETLAPKVGYTGPLGNLYGAVDDALDVLPGDSGARGAFRSASTEAQLTFTERTKGAITEREMALFAAAVPSLSQTPEANQKIAEGLRAGARRTQTRAKFFEEFAAKQGSLQGADDAWDAYIASNPLLVEQGDTFKVMPEGDWRSYLPGNENQGASGGRPTVGQILQMSDEELEAFVNGG